ncbi:arsenical pump-driving ATPase [Ruminiclostridium hungatei]|uniref:arsenite-transporting ATPase n=1 Tax=Ruminiclostridium hungatei TaxID=48256 RepID=A0A1V4SN91_RUMHU|nr:ArsA family ATPase [Ruminiclostridium hungatei]OPX44935.1 arsenical pump-driving ATPase [Ruminiclostridium hungatei]
MRIILYTGKGGVGKTSIAAATACKIASGEKKVLIMSTDMAHSLGDSFDVKLSNEPAEISRNLYAMEIDPVLENEKSWGNIKVYFEKLMVLKAERTVEAEELLVFPGFDELMSLLRIKDIYDEDKYDVLIVDCAPTGETMSLLKFPDLFKWWMEKLFPIKRKGARLARPVIQATLKVPVPSEETFDDVERLYNRIDQLHKLLQNKEVVSIRIVTTPEKIVVREAKRSFSYLHLFDYNVDGIIINKIFPQVSLSGYFQEWETIQAKSLQEVLEGFKGIPVFRLELLDKELRKIQILNEIGGKLYGDTDPEKILVSQRIFSVEKDAEGYLLLLNMPFVDKRELKLSQKGDEITIAVKNERRCLVLPAKLHSLNIRGAGYSDGKLKIHFAK